MPWLMVLLLSLLVGVLGEPNAEVSVAPVDEYDYTVVISVVVSVVSCLGIVLGVLGVAITIIVCRRRAARIRGEVETSAQVVLLDDDDGGQQKLFASLALRADYVDRYRALRPSDYRIGFWTYNAESSKRVQLLDTMYLFRHRDIHLRGESERKFSDIFYNLRSGKYTPYSHCKFCYLEQREFYARHGQSCCVKCGLPLALYVDFEPEERFCILCALMNKYHPRPHIRCLLHPSGKGKKLGAMYVLYKEYFSISSASKPKKRTPKSVKLQQMLHPEIWKLNSAIRFEFLWIIRRLVRVDLASVDNFEQAMQVLEDTRKETERRLTEIGPTMPMNCNEHGLDIDLSGPDFSEINKRKFFASLRELLEQTRRKIIEHKTFIMMQQAAAQAGAARARVGMGMGMGMGRIVLPPPVATGHKRRRMRTDVDSDMRTDDSRSQQGVSPGIVGQQQPRRKKATSKRRRKNDGTYVQLNVNLNITTSSHPVQPGQTTMPLYQMQMYGNSGVAGGGLPPGAAAAAAAQLMPQLFVPADPSAEFHALDPSSPLYVQLRRTPETEISGIDESLISDDHTAPLPRELNTEVSVDVLDEEGLIPQMPAGSTVPIPMPRWEGQGKAMTPVARRALQLDFERRLQQHVIRKSLRSSVGVQGADEGLNHPNRDDPR